MTDRVQDLQPLIVITGPTATGKTEVGVMVAESLNGEIISADSMLVYRGMDIGTAKPTRAEMKDIPHHLIDIIEPGQQYSAALFQSQARSLIDEISARGKLPILVGGTGLYVRAVIDEYDFSGSGENNTIREQLSREALNNGPESLHQRLSKVDPSTAAKLHPGDTRRVIRALEVYYLTGKPISSYQRLRQDSKPRYHLFMFGLIMERTMLYQRIEQRVDKMMAAGLVAEVQGLLQKGFPPELSSMHGLGYKEIISYLTGEVSLDEAVSILKRNTRRFAKRQLTWFRRDSRIKWLDIEKYGGRQFTAKEITKYIKEYFEVCRK